MGRKIDMKKIENITKCQVTFSKRRSSLIKKANEISICCDVDVAFVAFSPSGRVTKFSNKKRIEEVLNLYVNLPADKRLSHISNVEGKMEKLKQVGHINGDTSKLQYLDKQIENLELQIKKSGLELQILETDLRDYELGPEQEPSLHQLSWCERNLNHSLQRVVARKDYLQINQMELQNQPQAYNENAQVSSTLNPIDGKNILMQLDPWISTYSAKARETMLNDIFDQVGNVNVEPLDNPSFSNQSNFSIQQSSTFFGSDIGTPNVQTTIPLQAMQPIMVDQPLLNFQDQINVNAWNNTPPVVFSDATQMSTQSLSNIQDPRFIMINPSHVKLARSIYDEMGAGMQYTNQNLIAQFGNMHGGHEKMGDEVNMNQSNSFINANHRNENAQACLGNETQNINMQDAYYVRPSEEGCVDPYYGSCFSQDSNGDNIVWSSMLQKTGLWEWEDLLLDENFNFYAPA